MIEQNCDLWLNRFQTNAVCLLTNIPGFSTVRYKIDYTFDPVGNLTNRVITGLQGMTVTDFSLIVLRPELWS